MAKTATASEPDTFEATSRAEWRHWLEQHYATATAVWLVSHKKASGKPGVSYPDAVEEALCFGWIDSRPNALDAERYKQYFSPRKRGSPWSKVNKERIARLLDQGLMTDAGLAKIEAAKQDGSWSAYDAIEALTVPADLAKALRANKAAKRGFDAFSASAKKQLLWWVASAKRPETRAKRIERLVAEAADDRNPLDYRANKAQRR